MAHTKVDLSIVIPAYKEGQQFGDNLEKLEAFIGNRGYGVVEIIVMLQNDDQSGDVEAAAIEARKFKNVRIINLGQRAGKGGAVRTGIFAATGRYRMFMDADLATPLIHLDDVAALMAKDAQIGIAVRDLWSIHKGLIRKLISKSSNIAAQILVTPGIKDTQCGFKVFRADVAEELFGRQTMLSWSFDAEILAIARHMHYTIDFINAPDWRDPKPNSAGLVGDSPVAAALNGLLDLFKIRIALWKGKYHAKTFVYQPSSK